MDGAASSGQIQQLDVNTKLLPQNCEADDVEQLFLLKGAQLYNFEDNSLQRNILKSNICNTISVYMFKINLK